jgi:flagellar assembly protein FliH
VGFELSHAEAVGRGAIARALDLAPAGATIVVTLSPEDAASLGDPASLAPGRSVEVVADPALSPGDCIVDDASCRVEARLSEALARVSAVLADHGYGS